MSGKSKKTTYYASEEVLNEGIMPRGRKRKRQDMRSHKDDEKDRRKAIATEFEELKLYLPEEKRCKARQELLGNIRDLVWELWRNQEIIELAKSDIMTSKVCELERNIVMKRDKRRRLQEIVDSGTHDNLALGDYAPAPLIPDMGQDEVTASSCRFIGSQEHVERLSEDQARAEVLSEERAEVLSFDDIRDQTSEPDYTMEVEEYADNGMSPSDGDIFYQLERLVSKHEQYSPQGEDGKQPKIEYVEGDVAQLGASGSYPDDSGENVKYESAEKIIRDTYSMVGIHHEEEEDILVGADHSQSGDVQHYGYSEDTQHQSGDVHQQSGADIHHYGDCQSVFSEDDSNRSNYLQQTDSNSNQDDGGYCRSDPGRCEKEGRAGDGDDPIQGDGVCGGSEYNLNCSDQDSTDDTDLLDDMYNMQVPPTPPHLPPHLFSTMVTMPWAAPFLHPGVQVPIPMGGGYQFAVPICLPHVSNGADDIAADDIADSSADTSAGADSSNDLGNTVGTDRSADGSADVDGSAATDESAGVGADESAGTDGSAGADGSGGTDGSASDQSSSPTTQDGTSEGGAQDTQDVITNVDVVN